MIWQNIIAVVRDDGVLVQGQKTPVQMVLMVRFYSTETLIKYQGLEMYQ